MGQQSKDAEVWNGDSKTGCDPPWVLDYQLYYKVEYLVIGVNHVLCTCTIITK